MSVASLNTADPSPIADRIRSFIDLRAFAAQAQLRGPAEGPDAWHARRDLDLAEGPVAIGWVGLAAGDDRVAHLAADEFVILLEGDLSIEAGETRLQLEADASAVLPQGCAFAWRTEGGASLLIMRHAGQASGDAVAPLAIDRAAGLEPSNPPLAELLVGPTPQCRNHTDYRSADGAFTCGVWDSTPYHRRSMGYRHHELMHLLAGAVTFEDGAGRRATFRAGDIFLVEQGAACSWLSVEDVTKIYAIYRPV
jgi:uncharacterized cupin superfamily protein